MKNWQIKGLLSILILGFLLMSGCTNAGSTKAAPLVVSTPTSAGQPQKMVTFHIFDDRGGSLVGADVSVTSNSTTSPTGLYGISKQVGTTDSSGRIVFTLSGNIKYDVVITYKGRQNYYSIYPQENSYLFTFSTPAPKSSFEQIKIRLWNQKNATNLSYIDLGATYYDAGSSTDNLKFTVSDEKGNNIYTSYSATPNNWNVSFPVLTQRGVSYIWTIKGNSTDYPLPIQQSQVIGL
jgi:hypothetical protein